MNRLLDPKVQSQQLQYITEKQMVGILKKLKQKKYGMKDFAVEVEEVEVKRSMYVYNNLSESYRLKPGTYYHMRVEFIV